MEGIKSLIERYKHLRSIRSLSHPYRGKYAFVGIGSHSTSNLYPVLDYLHVPLKYICCKSTDKLRLIEAAYPAVHATTSLQEILADEEVKGVLVSASPQAHFVLATEVLKAGKALFIEKPPCQTAAELAQLISLRDAAGQPPVVVGLQKRCAPAMRKLRRELKKCGNGMSYNLKYLTGAYPEGDALLDLFIHPLDYVTFLFGKAEVAHLETVSPHTLMLILKHPHATGILELSTGYSWHDARESLTVNTPKGIYELEQMERLTFQRKPQTLAGVPMEKVFPHQTTTVELFRSNPFTPTLANNPIFTQGYFDTLKGFVDAVEERKAAPTQSLESLTDTYSLLDLVRSMGAAK